MEVAHPLIPIIAGPTAGGKTSLAIACAKLAEAKGLTPHAAVISADAFQVYHGLDIASAKPSMEERQGVPHHLIDIVEPSEPFTVAQWLALATQKIDEIEADGGWPIIAGGTHLYIKALIDGLFEGPPADEALREQLRAMPPAELRAELERVDPAAAQRIHPADQRRTIRAVEVHRLTGTPISDHQSQWDPKPDQPTNPLAHRLLLVTLQWPTPAINTRINARVKAMVADGLVEETQRLLDAGTLGPQAAQALGTKQILAHLQSGFPLSDAIERVKIETRRFAKNQRTWLRRLASDTAGPPQRMAFHPEWQDAGEFTQSLVQQCFTPE